MEGHATLHVVKSKAPGLFLTFTFASLLFIQGHFASGEESSDKTTATVESPKASTTPPPPKDAPAVAGKFAIYFISENPSDNWMAKAYQGSIEENISGFSNLQLLTLSPEMEGELGSACKPNAQDFFTCALAKAKTLDSPFDFLFLGRLEDATLYYRIFERDSEALFGDGSIDVAGISAVGLQVAALHLIKPFTKGGGIIDQILGEDHKLLTLDLPEFLQPFIPTWLLGVASSALALLGGICWGFVVLILGRFCMGSIHGVDRVSADALTPFLRAWTEVFLLKLFGALALLAPVYLTGWFLTSSGLITLKFFLLFLFPTLALLMILLLLISSWMIAEVFERLYLRKINVPAWNDKIKKYFVSYASKLGVDIPEKLLREIRFTAGNTTKVVCVGGGLVETTIIIPNQMAVLALEEIDTSGAEAEGRDPRMGLEEKSVITPASVNQVKSIRKSEESYDNFKKDFIKQLEGEAASGVDAADFSDRVEIKREINQEASVWGIILPRTKDKSIPLISDTSEDLEVVDDLIREHHVQYYRPQAEEVFDDLDKGYRDFLFGILLQKVIMIRRWEHVLCNYHHLLNNFIDKTPGIFSILPKIIRALYERNMATYYEQMNDQFVCFFQGHHHLIQYYFLLLNGRKRELTQKASFEKLIMTSNKIANWLSENPADPREDTPEKVVLRRRLQALTLAAMIEEAPPILAKRKIWRKVGLTLAALAGVGMEGAQSYHFHEVYLERQSALAKQIEDYETEQNPGAKANEVSKAALSESATPTEPAQTPAPAASPAPEKKHKKAAKKDVSAKAKRKEKKKTKTDAKFKTKKTKKTKGEK